MERSVAPPRRDAERHVLVAVSRPVEGSEAVEKIAAAAGSEDGEILLLAPAETKFLDRWASDVRRAHAEAQRKLVISVASLAAADLDARARVGDEDIVQAVEDALRTFPATEVILATGSDSADRQGAAAARASSSAGSKPRSSACINIARSAILS